MSNNEIKRYHPYITWRKMSPCAESPNGMYVLYEDHINELNACKQQVLEEVYGAKSFDNFISLSEYKEVDE